ncbi:MAG TPA: hypothetical protein VMX18_02740 [Candidatus Bipolaricaulota bacterium]|nr:hypothetical protein [Candidatus Bipolaricaulota bacterium]
MIKTKNKAWVVAVTMGYGHQRAAFPLKDIAYEGIITANDYSGIPDKDARIWRRSRKFYEFVSRLKHVPFLGNEVFKFYDKYFQNIDPFYPRRDLSAATFQIKQMYRYMEKGWGRHLIEYLNHENIPLITTFFVPAFFAEFHNFKNDIYVVITDTDVSRTWAPLEPKKSRLKYFAPTKRAVDRLIEYGIRKENIFLTGFPLPKENIDGHNLEILKKHMGERICNLDPKNIYRGKYEKTIEENLPAGCVPDKVERPLTITFAVGGAGAQREIGDQIIGSLKKKINEGQVKINLVAGVRNEIYKYFERVAAKHGFGKDKSKVDIIYSLSFHEYMDRFNQALLTTDILWTKPSELSFYCALGIPIIIAPPIGSQELFNQMWLESIGAGMDQLDPRYADQWLFDWLDSGWLAEAAMEGYLDAHKLGTKNIESIIAGKIKKAESLPQIL